MKYYVAGMLSFALAAIGIAAGSPGPGGDGFPPVYRYSGGAVIIKDWAVAGPIAPESIDDGLDDLQKDYGLDTHAEVRIADLVKLHANASLGLCNSAAFGNSSVVTETDVFLDLQHMFRRSYSQYNPTAAVYVSCRIVCETSAGVTLLLRGASLSNLWINGRKQGAFRPNVGANHYQAVTDVALVAGANEIVIRVENNGKQMWGVAARVEPSRELAAVTAMKMQRHFGAETLAKRVIDPDGVIEPVLGGVPKGAEFRAVLTDLDGKDVCSPASLRVGDRWTPDIGKLRGVYQMQVIFNGETYTDRICLGRPEEVAKTIDQRIDRCAPLAAVEAANVAVLKARIAALLESQSKQEKGNWETKMIAAMMDYQQAADDLEAGGTAFTGRPGLRLRGFTSSIDGQLQAYRVFAPKGIQKGAKIPFVVVLATPVATPTPFFKSSFLAFQNETDQLCETASELNIGIIWPGYRSQPSGAPCDSAHVAEVLREVGRDYNIDGNRLCLLGVCTGGAISAQFASRWPGLFAGIALLDPKFTLGKLTDEALPAFRRSEEYGAWLRSSERDTRTLLSQRDVPCLILYDGLEPGHGALWMTEEFVAQAKESGFPVKVIEEPRSLEKHFQAFSELLRWCAAQRRESSLQVSTLSAINALDYDSNVAAAVAQPFVLVRGTHGSEAENKRILEISDAIVRKWKELNFGDCQVVDDTKSKVEDYSARTLVLVGNAETNAVWKSVQHEVGVEMNRDGVRIGTHNWKGDSIFVETLHSLSGGGNVVLVGSNNLTAAAIPFASFSAAGWFRFAVWSMDRGKPTLLAAGI